MLFDHKLRLLFLDFNIPYLLNNSEIFIGGASVRLFAFCQGLIQNGHNVGILTWKGARDFVNSENDFELLESYSKNYGLKYFRWVYYRIPKLLSTIKIYNTDFLIQRCAGFDTDILGIISKLLKIPFVYMVANDIDVGKKINTILSFQSRIFYNIGFK